jgi:hypothetical protein
VTPSLLLPRAGGRLERYRLGVPTAFARPRAPLASRRLYAAAHVVADPLTAGAAGGGLDWDATLAYRRHLWSWGLGVADAMDTAQRGMGLDYPTVRDLIAHSAAEARAVGGALACGVATDQLPAGERASLDRIAAAYLEQARHVAAQGATIVLMASRHLAAVATGPADYRTVYDRVLTELDGPVILHWLGDMFDPALAGYWGFRDLDRATDACLGLLHDHAAKIDGIKLSLLDRDRELELRRRLPAGVRMYTGDDFHYDELIAGERGGEGGGHSDALLGIFDAIAPAASAAVQALDAGDPAAFRRTLAPTLPLARHLFGAPTFHYKTGIVFLAYLNGHQDHFRMVGGLESARSVTHLAEAFVLADRAGLLADPAAATRRMAAFLELAGVR